MKKNIFIIMMTLAFSMLWAADLEQWQIKAPIMCPESIDYHDFTHQDSTLYTPVINTKTFYINADEISGSQTTAHFAQGNVQTYQDSQTLLSDWLYLQQEEYNHVIAGDHFVFTREYDIINGEYFDYYFDLHQGFIKNGEIFYPKKNLTIKSKGINISDRKHFNVFEGMFTSCKIDDPDWYITAETMNFDYQKSEAEGKYGALYFGSVPVVKGKNIMFPLGERKSGWLRPTVGSTKNNAYVQVPYYWNTAPNYDNTLTPRIWTQSGLMITDEQRYLIDHGSGTWYTEQMPFDMASGNKYRWYYNIDGVEYNNDQQDITFKYKYKQVSDQNYFFNFGDYDTITKNVNLEQSAALSAKESWGNSNIIVQNYQVVIPTDYNAAAIVYSKLPQISYNSSKADIYGFELGLNSNYTYFYNQQQTTGQNAQRLFLYPSLSYPLESQWGFIRPEVDGFLDYYALYANPSMGVQNSDAHIQAPIFSIDSGLKFDTDYHNYYLSQTFEPRVYYEYIPEVDQKNVPVFDSATAAYNYNQLFTPLNYAGYDRVNKANNVTFGFTSRIMNDLNNLQAASLGVAYQQYFFNSNAIIYGDPNTYPQLYLPQPNFIVELAGNPNQHNNFNAGIQLNTTTSNDTTNNIDNFSLGYQFNPEDYKVLNTKFRYQYHQPLLFYNQVSGKLLKVDYENQYALDVSGQWPVYKQTVLIAGRSFYDFTATRMISLIGGITYNRGCWSASIVGQSYIDQLSQRNWNLMLELELNQIGKLATETALGESLKNNIPGYKTL